MSVSRYYKRPPEYKVWQKAYARKYAKRPQSIASRKAWLKTDAGREYRSRAMMAHYWRNREWIDAYKMERGCAECGFKKWPEALDFDHIDRSTKKFNISQTLRLYKNSLMAEIAKCQILCANCHRHKTKKGAPHGFTSQL